MAHIDDRRWIRDRKTGDRIRTDYKGPNPWRARYRTPDGQARSRSFARRVDAERFLTTVESRKLLGDWVDPAAGRVRFKDYAEAWQRVQVHRESTAAQVDSHLRNHVIPKFGDRQLASIRPSDVQAFVKGLSDKLAPATVEVVYRYLASIFNAAIEDRIITRTPCKGVKLPKQDRKQLVPLETEQVHALIEAIGQRYKALVLFAAGTGLRQGEVFGVQLDRVDFLRRQVAVDQQLMLLANQAPKLAPPKTDASYRKVPLPDVVLDALAAHVAEHPVGDGGLVFTNDHDSPISRTRFSDQVWRPAVKAAGLPEGTRFHELRHYYASLLIRHGESVKVVQSRLGHASAAETLDTYSHLWPDNEDRTRHAVDQYLGRCEGKRRPATGSN